MNSSFERSTEINLNIIAKTVTEKAKTNLTATVNENVENLLFNITNLTEESQYNESTSDLNVALKSNQEQSDEEKPELNPTWMIIQITFVFVSICALILRSFYTICWEEKQKKIQKKLSRLESSRSTRVELDGITEEEEVFLQPKRVQFDNSNKRSLDTTG